MLLLCGLTVCSISIQLFLMFLDLLWCPHLTSFGVGLVQVGLLGLQLQVILTRTLIDFKRVEGIALEICLTIQVHVLERQLTQGAHVPGRTVLFIDASNGSFLAFVLRFLLRLQFIHHRHFLH